MTERTPPREIDVPRRAWRIGQAAALTLAMWSSGGCASGLRCPPFDTSRSLEQNVDTCVTTYAAKDGAGVAVAVVEDGVVVLAKGYGQVHRAEHIAATSRTPFYLASVSKPLTAMALLRLVDRGDVRLGDSIVIHR